MALPRFRYVPPSRVEAYLVLGWTKVADTFAPHDLSEAVLMEWSKHGAPIDPPGTRKPRRRRKPKKK